MSWWTETVSRRHGTLVLQDTARDPPAKLLPRARPIPRAHRNARKRQTVPLPASRPSGPGVDVSDRSLGPPRPAKPAHARIFARRERTRSHHALEARHCGRSHVSLAFLSPTFLSLASLACQAHSASPLGSLPCSPRPRIRRELRLRLRCRLLRRAGPSSPRLPCGEVRPQSPHLSAPASACLFVLRACASGWVFEP